MGRRTEDRLWVQAEGHLLAEMEAKFPSPAVLPSPPLPSGPLLLAPAGGAEICSDAQVKAGAPAPLLPLVASCRLNSSF